MRRFILIFLAASSCLATPSFAAESLGNKYSCNGKALKLNGKGIKLSAAKTALSSSITSTRAALKRARSGSSAAHKLSSKLSSLRNTLTLVKSCGAGTLVPKVIQNMAVSYPSGTWNNTTFSTSGAISANFSLTGKILSVSINIGGQMFGSLTPAPVEFDATVGGVAFPIHFTKTGTSIGDLDITITSNGGLQIEETLIPGRADLQRATLDATYASGGFTGTFHSYFLGGTQLAQGTMTLSQ